MLNMLMELLVFKQSFTVGELMIEMLALVLELLLILLAVLLLLPSSGGVARDVAGSWYRYRYCLW